MNGSLINSLVNCIEMIMDVGRNLGTALRRIFTNNICK